MQDEMKKRLQEYWRSQQIHARGTLDWATLSYIYDLLAERKPEMTAETGCGASTIAFALHSQKHLAFCLDDRGGANPHDSSYNYIESSGLVEMGKIDFVFGPTQNTLPKTPLPLLDAVLLDGPHAFPFPELEYFYFYPRLRTGGVLIIDDLQIPSIQRMYEVLREDVMFVEIATFRSNTAFLERTSSISFCETGDGWWEQRYNRRRLPQGHAHYLADYPTHK